MQFEHFQADNVEQHIKIAWIVFSCRRPVQAVLSIQWQKMHRKSTISRIIQYDLYGSYGSDTGNDIHGS